MRPFTDVIRDHRNGKLVNSLTERLAKVVAAVQETGKGGSITLSLAIKPSKGDEDAFEVVPTISAKLPEADLPKALFYADDSGSLVRESPVQRGIFDADDTDLGSAPRRRRSGED